jgi:hypothetical protein
MATTTFNAITYANKLKEAGMAVRVADVQAEEMSEFINSTLATKEDLLVMEKSIKAELKGFIVHALIVTVSVIGGLQGIMQYMK